jgi:DNA-binding helix-hairpin-helix protein with protein kinase domain
MTQLFDSLGRAISLGTQLGSGGEGAVFELANDKESVAKVYHKPISDLKADKLRCMAALHSPEVRQYAAWPASTLHDRPSGRVVGIIMPRVDGHEEIHNLYSPAHRKIKYPDKDWAFLAHVAMNCAAAFDAIHNKSLVVGDVNEGNLLVSRQGTVCLIDCDSFQIAGNGKLFTCEVGTPEFTPPEAQGRGFQGFKRTANHDCFGLAILIFRLLFMGRHPFAGRFLGRGEMSIERAIGEFRFAFSQSAAILQMARPPDTLPLEQVAPDIAPLFERAFARDSVADGKRPGAKEWHASLTALKQQLRKCGADSGHTFHSGLSTCPWCEIMRAGGPNFFISVTVAAVTIKSFAPTVDVQQLWVQIESIKPPKAAYVKPAFHSNRRVAAKPVSAALASSAKLNAWVGRATAVGLMAAVVSALAPVLLYFSLPFFIAFSVWWMILFVKSPYSIEKHRRKAAARESKHKLTKLQHERETLGNQYQDKYYNLYERLIMKRENLKRLKTDYDAEYQKLVRDCAARQLSQFLQNKFICDYKIDKIGPGRTAVLASYGIETANDIERRRLMSIPGFGPALTNILLAWRRDVSAQFHFDSSRGVPPNEVQALNLKFVILNRQLETDLRGGAGNLQSIVDESNRKLANVDLWISISENEMAQAAADLAVMK